MKRLICVLLTVAAVFALYACTKASEPAAASSGMGGKRLYILAERGAGQLYYKVLELHPGTDFDGADDPMDGKYAEFLDMCPSLPAGYENWTNAEAEKYLRGRPDYFERIYTASQLSKFNDLGLTVAGLHSLLNKSFGAEDIVKMSADDVIAALTSGHE